MLNFQFFTFGGMYYWIDVYTFNGWRIQRNIWTKRCRLLDPYQIRRFSGKFDACKDKLEYIEERWKLQKPVSSRAIVFIHGLHERPAQFDEMALKFKKKYEIIYFSYPMLRHDFIHNAELLNALLNSRGDLTEISFVCSGTGAFILRQAISKDPAWLEKYNRSVFISCATKGYKIFQSQHNKLWFKFLFGEARYLLLEKNIELIPDMNKDYATIYGGKGDKKGFTPWFKMDNDGFVPVCDMKDPKARLSYLAINKPRIGLLKDKIICDLAYNFITTANFATGKVSKKSNSYQENW
ncbi:MAG: hypothetical protein MJ247_01655 [Alphaproteobacteria bacterium]|nr:hypothetical protein [Alphaproteobacteria bacterium]